MIMELVYRTIIPNKAYWKMNYQTHDNGARLSNYYLQWNLSSANHWNGWNSPSTELIRKVNYQLDE
jgi:hypothetical protein